ncbi:MAG: asparagine--tRNA ligase [Coxiellaceae bacterium]|nr:asparagine--tRNA ligase [Coxiellaceae bacterium]|tara:strand:- start:15792 stop:17201 length:1410 start_codon:yes stop_codon:yes gene_type:complete
MKQFPSVKDILQPSTIPQTAVTVRGWVRTRRDSKAGISFIALSDGSCFDSLQLVIPNTLVNYETDITRLTTGCAIKATGQLVQSLGKNQSVEMQVTDFTVVGDVQDPDSYPMAAKRHSMEHLREHSHLRPRTNIIGAVSRVRNSIAQAVHRFFNEEGFVWINTPILTACDCEGAGELFTVTAMNLNNIPKNEQGKVDYRQDFFGQPAYLTCSGQLNVESYCMALSKVYTFGPTFRAENSNTTRHLAEFWMIEPEIAFADLNDDIELAQQLLQYVCRDILERHPDDMDFFNQWVDKTCLSRVEQLVSTAFECIDYTDAISHLEKAKQTFEHPVHWGIDLQTEHERYLTDTLFKKPVVVKNYPKDIKAFYMRMNDDQKTVAAMDVLLPGIGELIGGSQREERLDVLESRITTCGLPVEEYQWYCDLRRYGSTPHAGFGLGFERLVRYITGVSNLRDTIPFPRTPKSIPPNH